MNAPIVHVDLYVLMARELDKTSRQIVDTLRNNPELGTVFVQAAAGGLFQAGPRLARSVS